MLCEGHIKWSDIKAWNKCQLKVMKQKYGQFKCNAVTYFSVEVNYILYQVNMLRPKKNVIYFDTKMKVYYSILFLKCVIICIKISKII
jgi:hypothetical protein